MSSLELPPELPPATAPTGANFVWEEKAADFPRHGPPGLSYWCGRVKAGDLVAMSTTTGERQTFGRIVHQPQGGADRHPPVLRPREPRRGCRKRGPDGAPAASPAGDRPGPVGGGRPAVVDRLVEPDLHPRGPRAGVLIPAPRPAREPGGNPLDKLGPGRVSFDEVRTPQAHEEPRMTSTADIPCGNPQHQATKDLNLPCIGCDLDGRTLTLGELVAIDAAFLLHCPEGDDFGVAEEDERIEALGRLLGSMADEAAAAEAAKLLGLTAP